MPFEYFDNNTRFLLVLVESHIVVVELVMSVQAFEDVARGFDMVVEPLRKMLEQGPLSKLYYLALPFIKKCDAILLELFALFFYFVSTHYCAVGD